MTNAMGLLLIRTGLSLLKDGHNGAADKQTAKFVDQLNDLATAEKMSQIERRYKVAFIRSHNMIDKLLCIVPTGKVIEEAGKR